MRVGEPLTARALGLLGRRHGLACSGLQVATVQPAGRAGRLGIALADGATYDVLPLAGRRWLLWQGEREIGQAAAGWAARRAEMVYEAVPYFIAPIGWRGRYRLVNEADAEVLTIAFRGPLRREATLYPQIALDLILVVFAYQLARRLL